MSHRQRLLENLGYPIDRQPLPAALYESVVLSGQTAFVSGALPTDGPLGLVFSGKLGRELTVADGQKAAALAAANILRVLAAKLGSLDRIERILKISGYVSSADGFIEQHLVVNGASELFVSVLGEAGRHARAAVGVLELPLGAPVEIEAIIQVQGS